MDAIIRNASRRYVVITIVPGQVSASMNARARKLTGCSGTYVNGSGRSSIERIREDGVVQTYASIKAIQAEREMHGVAPAIRMPEYDA